MTISEVLAMTPDLDAITPIMVGQWAACFTSGNQAAVVAAIARERRRRGTYLASIAMAPQVAPVTAASIRAKRAKQAEQVAMAETTGPTRRRR